MDYIIPAVTSIVVAIIGAMSAKDMRWRIKTNAINEVREKNRMEESRLSMEMMSASIDLGVATAMAVEGHKINGEMKAAKEKAAIAQSAYYKFINTIAAQQIAKV